MTSVWIKYARAQLLRRPSIPQKNRALLGDGATIVNPAAYNNSLPSILAYQGPIRLFHLSAPRVPLTLVYTGGMKAVIVGTAGHIDHGKSALVRALTGTDPDRLEEEKRRGITIDIGFANLDLAATSGEKLRLGFVDVPGHERFVRNMLAGIGGIDLVLLVIAADESVKPQTREHFDICRLLSV